MRLNPGDPIGGYHLIQQLGHGPMGEVWRARHGNAIVSEGQGGDVVIRLLPSWQSDAFRALLEPGVALRHPSLASAFGLVQTNGRLALVLEFVPGPTLEDWLRTQGGSVDWETAWPLLAQLFDVVAFLHDRGRVHADLSPARVHVLPDGGIKLLGAAISHRLWLRARDEEVLLQGDDLAYAGLQSAGPLDPREDVYPLAAIAYRALAGAPPDPTSDGALPPVPGVPPHVMTALQQGLRRKRDLRPQSVAALRALLEAPAAPPAADGQPDLLGGYRLLQRLGEGGMGEVWRARHENPRVSQAQGGDVAIKRIHGQYARNESVRARFHREVEIGLSLQHPGIVRSFGLVEDGEELGLVMEYVPGETLDDWLHSVPGPLPWAEARSAFEQLMDALEYAHDHGVIHRDMKPSNVMRRPTGEIKILDFGIARRRDSKMTATRSGMGTVDYMAPEQYTHAKAVDGRADIYALGMTLYQMLAGRLPWDPELTEFDVMLKKSKEATLPSPAQFNAQIPSNVVRCLQACIHSDRDKRPPDVAALRRLLGTAKRAPAPAPRPQPTARPAVPKPSAPQPQTTAQPPAPAPTRAPPLSPKQAVEALREDNLLAESRLRTLGAALLSTGGATLLGMVWLALHLARPGLVLVLLGVAVVGVSWAGYELRANLTPDSKRWATVATVVSLALFPMGTVVGVAGWWALNHPGADTVCSEEHLAARQATPFTYVPEDTLIWGATVGGAVAAVLFAALIS